MIENFIATHNINLIQLLFITIGYLMPIPLSIIALNLWHHYKTEEFISGIKWVLLEIQVPRDVIKSPSTMELIFSNAFFHKSEKGFWEQYIQGAPWFWFSLEIASIDGKVHFFIRTPTRMRDLVETQIYSQYPQAKVIEVDDYAFSVPQYKKDGDLYVWGCEFTKANHDAKPIRTYKNVDELKSGTKEEFKVDPITPTIEFLGSLSRGEQVWIQIIVRQSIKKYHSHKTGKHVDFYFAAAEEIERMLKPFTRNERKKDSPPRPTFSPDLMFTADVLAPEHLKKMIQEMSRHMSLLHFDCGIRLVVACNKNFVSEERFNNIRRSSRLLFRQYSQPNINEIIRTNSTQFDAPWSDPTGLAMTKVKKRMLDWYRLRIFFHPPIQYSINYPDILSAFFPSGKPKVFVMSTEELATIFHFPGMVSETPSFKRIESKIAKPPANLPL